MTYNILQETVLADEGDVLAFAKLSLVEA